jgi:ribosomal-protein-alanine N-acetyltransferase
VTGETHAAAIEDVRRLWPAVSAAHIFDTREELERWWRDAPWRVRVTAAGEGAVLGRWRRDLDLLAVRGLWCAARRMPALIEGLRDVAKGEGFGRLLGPFVPEDAAGPYLASGMAVDKRIVVYRRRATVATFPLSPHPGGPPDQFTLREARPEDADAILRLDGTCFDSFWRYDEEHVTAALATGRGVLAEVEGEVIGYTLCTLYGAEATVGRLAVATSRRRRGVGSALLSDAVAFAARSGAAAVTLCTQEENAASRGLYRRAGFREAPGRLVSTVSAPL